MVGYKWDNWGVKSRLGVKPEGVRNSQFLHHRGKTRHLGNFVLTPWAPAVFSASHDSCRILSSCFFIISPSRGVKSFGGWAGGFKWVEETVGWRGEITNGGRPMVGQEEIVLSWPHLKQFRRAQLQGHQVISRLAHLCPNERGIHIDNTPLLLRARKQAADISKCQKEARYMPSVWGGAGP